MPRYAHIGARGIGFRGLGQNRMATFSTLPKVTLGRNRNRVHIHGIDSATQTFFNTAFSVSSASTPNPNDLWIRKTIDNVDKLVKDLKSSNFWDSCNIVYPFALYHPVGSGTFGTGYNLKDPSTFFLSFAGNAALHNQYGTTFNNGSSSCNTGFNPGTTLGTNDWHCCAYVQSQDGSVGASLNVLTSSNATGAIDMYIDPTGSIGADGNGRSITATVGSRKGVILLTRTSSSLMTLYRNGLSIGTNSSTVVNSLPSRTQKLMFNESGTNFFCIVPFSFFSMGSSFTSDQAFRFSQIVQDYQTRMGRGC